jgi:hypothetical protein
LLLLIQTCVIACFQFRLRMWRGLTAALLLAAPTLCLALCLLLGRCGLEVEDNRLNTPGLSTYPHHRTHSLYHACTQRTSGTKTSEYTSGRVELLGVCEMSHFFVCQGDTANAALEPELALGIAWEPGQRALPQLRCCKAIRWPIVACGTDTLCEGMWRRLTPGKLWNGQHA